MDNFRPVRGTRPGVLFRSDALPWEAHKLRDHGIKLICDLRSAREVKRSPHTGDVRVVNISLHDDTVMHLGRRRELGFAFSKRGAEDFHAFTHDYYRHIAFERTTQLRDILSMLTDDANLPAVIHCTAGKDRTGFVVAIIQLLVGVPFETVMEDYLHSNTLMASRFGALIRKIRKYTLGLASEERLRLLLSTQPEFLGNVYDRLITEHGNVESYLQKACGIDAATVAALKAQLGLRTET